METFTLPHKIAVCRLYRRALRTAMDWYYHRDHLRKASIAIRRQFEKNKNEADPARLRLLLAVTESLLNRTRHPEPYIAPTAVGGLCYERQYIIPKQIREHGYDEFKDSVR